MCLVTSFLRVSSPDSGLHSTSAPGSTDPAAEEPSRKFWDEMGQIGLPDDINVSSLFDPTGRYTYTSLKLTICVFQWLMVFIILLHLQASVALTCAVQPGQKVYAVGRDSRCCMWTKQLTQGAQR